MLTNETQFGLVATEPGKKPLVTLDGRTKEWRGKTVQHDPAYLYLRAPGARKIAFDDDVLLTLGRAARASVDDGEDPMPSVFGAAGRDRRVGLPRLILSRPFTVGGVDHPMQSLGLGALRRGSEHADARNLIDGRRDTHPVDAARLRRPVRAR